MERAQHGRAESRAIHLVGGPDGVRRAALDLVRTAGGDPATLRLALDAARAKLATAPGDEDAQRCVDQLEAALCLLGARP